MNRWPVQARFRLNRKKTFNSMPSTAGLLVLSMSARMTHEWRQILEQHEKRILELEGIIREKDRTIQSLLEAIDRPAAICQQDWTTRDRVASSRKADPHTKDPNLISKDSPSTSPRYHHHSLPMNPTSTRQPLSSHQIERYSRQLMIPNGFGMEGQYKLQSSSVLVIGAGGIGSTVILYLAAAGIGHVTIVDHDTVELSNLHRQIIHSQDNIGMNKAQSAVLAVRRLNSTISTTAITDRLTGHNAFSIVQNHHLVIDASDNAETRYCVNEACVLAGNIPLVSGSAMGLEGQVSVYVNNQCAHSHDKDKDTIREQSHIGCYQCMYPTMPRSEACKSCNDHGVLGPIPGLIGILLSMEAVKIITGIGMSMDNRLLMYDAMQPSFLFFKKPPRREDCLVCASPPPSRRTSPLVGSQDIMDSSSTIPTPVVAHEKEDLVDVSYPEITWEEYMDSLRNQPHVLLDVRVCRQYEMCSLPGSINIPLHQLKDHIPQIQALSEHGQLPIYCVCRRGIASLEATRFLTHLSQENPDTIPPFQVYNIQAGLHYWSKHIDPTFPHY